MTAALPDPACITAPAALRNASHILEQIKRFAPTEGRALELAAGSGEHAVRFAPELPGLMWQPTDVDPARLASIAAWRAVYPSPNLLSPRRLDVTEPGWGAREGPVDLVLLVNLLHLISGPAADTVLTELASALAPGGVALIYGPFLRNGRTTSPGDARFDADLRARDAAMGYKDVVHVAARLAAAGLTARQVVEMPANNLMLCFEANARVA